MEDIIQQSFKINLTVLNVLGLYSFSPSSLCVKVRGYFLYFTLLILATVLTLANILLGRNTNRMQRNLMITFVTETLGFWFKIFPFLRYGEKIKKCINFFAHKNFAPKKPKEIESTNECIRICRRNSTVYFYGLLGVELVWIFARDEFAIYPWLPYDPTSTNFAYYFTLAYTILVVLYNGFAGTITDPLIGGLAYHATAQIKILKYNLQYLDEHVHETTNMKRDDYKIIKYEMVTKHLKKCVNHHNSILRFVADYEDCFTWCVFAQFAGSMIALSFCCIGSTLVSLTSMSGATYIFCAMVMSSQILFYCHYGTLLYEENNTLIEAICMSSWYKYDVRIRRVLLLIMERSKRQMVFTAGAVVNVTLETFVSILKTSYSLVAVLNNISKSEVD